MQEKHSVAEYVAGGMQLTLKKYNCTMKFCIFYLVT